MLNLIIIFLFELIFIAIIIYYKDNFNFNRLSTLQDTHQGFVPPLGGVVIYLCFCLYTIFYIEKYIFNLTFFIGSSLIVLSALVDDLYKPIKPIYRLGIIFFASILIIYNFNNLPIINYPILNYITQNELSSLIFYSLALTLLANGTNIIDGTNGLTCLTILFILLNLVIVSFYLKIVVNNEVLLLIILTIGFLFFNFPKGRIFLGDSGAYFLGWVVGIFTIDIFANNSGLNPFIAFIILFYPVFEVCFSFARKIIIKKSPFFPDLNHIHLMMFHKINKTNNKNSNSQTTINLFALWLMPFPILLINLYIYSNIPLSIFVLIAIYVFYFIKLKKDKTKNI